jgi:uncharacterized protein YegL
MGRRRKQPRNRTRVFVVQDKSGSMSDLRKETVSGFNEYVDQLEGDMFLSLIQFDTGVHEVFVNRPLVDVPELTAEDFVPGGMTALRDGVGRAIKLAEDTVYGSDDKVMVVIMTDGYENSSREYTHDQILKKIEDKRGDGWEFVFLGAGEESWAASRAFGIADTHTINYGKLDAHDHGVVYGAMATSTNNMTRGAGAAFDVGVKVRLENKAKAEVKK